MKNSKLTANWDFIVSKTVNFCRLILSAMPYDIDFMNEEMKMSVSQLAEVQQEWRRENESWA